MKFVQLVLGILVIISAANHAMAQTATAGLYLTPDDFLQQKITYPVECNNGKDKLKLNDFWGSATGYVISRGEKHAFKKSKVYGYKTCKNENYRFYQNTAYRIIDTAGFYVYHRCMQTEQKKGFVKTDTYFFSTQADNTIQRLNSDNLKKAFPGNQTFQYALDAHFRSDKDLVAWDPYNKTYKIKYLYSQSLK